ncbi:hypothetical protein V5O48_008144, partial [Marasmius crinis-equi]
PEINGSWHNKKVSPQKMEGYKHAAAPGENSGRVNKQVLSSKKQGQKNRATSHMLSTIQVRIINTNQTSKHVAPRKKEDANDDITTARRISTSQTNKRVSPRRKEDQKDAGAGLQPSNTRKSKVPEKRPWR